VSKVDELETRVRAIVDELSSARRDNQRLRAEVDSLKGHVTLLSGENQKAQQILAQYEHLRRVHDQVTTRVERALTTLNSLRGTA
jgi:hypothetical protein